MSLQLLDFGQLHDRTADIPQALRGQVGAGDVLEVRGEVDARVLLRVAVRRCIRPLVCFASQAIAELGTDSSPEEEEGEEKDVCDLRNE